MRDLRRLVTFRKGELRFSIIFFGWIALRAGIGQFSLVVNFARKFSVASKAVAYIVLLYVLWEATRRFFREVRLHEKFAIPRVWLALVLIVSLAESVIWADRPGIYVLLEGLMIVSWILWGEVTFRIKSSTTRE